jgi:CDP-4-dehydro-6-deoxyglucose reductase, E1
MLKLVQGLFYNEEQTKQELCDFIMSTSQLSIGPQCAVFEEQFAAWQGRQYCTLFNSGSSANLALIQALLNLGQIKASDEVAFSAITWATNVMPLVQLGLTPVPVDVELETLNISSRTLQETLAEHPNIKVLFVTHILGFCGDLDEITAMCRERGIIVLEDTCESLGSVFQQKKLGNWGVGSTFSFFVGHHMTTIEGGAVCTDDAELDRMLRLVRAHGWDRNLTDNAKEEIRREYGVANSFFANYTFYTLGYNLRPTEITGFLGQRQLQYLDEIVSRRADNYQRFHEALSTNPDFVPLATDHLDVVSNFAMPVICRTPALAEHYIALFKAADVEIRPIVGGSVPEQPFYTKLYGATATIQNAHTINRHGFYFGNHPGLGPESLQILERLLKKETVPQQ